MATKSSISDAVWYTAVAAICALGILNIVLHWDDHREATRYRPTQQEVNERMFGDAQMRARLREGYSRKPHQ